MISSLKGCRVTVSPSAVAALVLLIFIDSTVFIIPMLLAALLHEAGHAAAVIMCGKRISGIKLLPFGAEMTVSAVTPLGYSQEIFVAAAGPAVNAFLFVATLLLHGLFRGNACISFFGGCNAVFMAINLLPVFPLDGGRILSAFLLCRLDIVRATRISDIVSLCALVPVLLLGIYTLAATGYNFSLLLIFVFLLISFLIRITKK